MNKKINELFPHCATNNCLEQHNLPVIEIYDDATLKKCIIHKEVSVTLNYPFFKIVNPNNKVVNFLAIDNCVLFECDGDKCDFAAFHDSNFYFVELKRGLGSDLNRSKKKEKAINQLKATLRLFTNNIDFRGYSLFACICVGYESPSPAAPASDLNNLVEFINDFNTELIEGKEINLN